MKHGSPASLFAATSPLHPANVEHERGAGIFEIDQMADRVAAGDKHRLNVRIRTHHVFGRPQDRDGRAAAHVQIHRPRPGRADFVRQMNACGCASGKNGSRSTHVCKCVITVCIGSSKL